MNTEASRSVRKHSWILGLFALATAVLVGSVNELTREQIINQRQQAERRALSEVLSPDHYDNDLLASTFALENGLSGFEDLELLGLTRARTAYKGRRSGQVSGVILPVEIHDAYGGDIVILVGVLADATVSGVRVLEHRETPGLGDKIDLRISDWILDFNGTSLQVPAAGLWQVKKDGGAFDQFVGATITPRAIVNGVRKSLLFFETNRSRLLDE